MTEARKRKPEQVALDDMDARIGQECDAIKELLRAKNVKYGNSALSPKRVLATGSALAQIAVRADDKLSRIANMGGLEAVLLGRPDDGEDTVQDLIGYLILARIASQVAFRLAARLDA